MTFERFMLNAIVTALLLAALLALAACQTTREPAVRTVEVKVPIAVKCSADPGPDPVYPDTDAALKAAPDLFERVKLLVAGRVMRMTREGELKAAVAGCK